MNTRTRIIYILVGLSVVVGLWAYWNRCATAQPLTSTISMSIAVCDPHKAFQEYRKTKDLRASLRKQLDKFRQELEAKEKRRRSSAEALTTTGLTPGSVPHENRRQELVRLGIEIKHFREISDNELVRERLRITQLGYDDVYAAVAEVAQKRKLTLVLSKQQFPLAGGGRDELFAKVYYRRPVLYADQGLDITDEVIELLNNKYKPGL